MKVELKPVSPGKFIGFIIGIFFFMVSNDMIIWGLKSTNIFLLLFFGGGVAIILGLTKPSTFAFAMEVLRVLQDERLTLGQRIALIRELITKFVGLAADLSELQAIEDKKNEDMPKIPTD